MFFIADNSPASYCPGSAATAATSNSTAEVDIHHSASNKNPVPDHPNYSVSEVTWSTAGAGADSGTGNCCLSFHYRWQLTWDGQLLCCLQFSLSVTIGAHILTHAVPLAAHVHLPFVALPLC